MSLNEEDSITDIPEIISRAEWGAMPPSGPVGKLKENPAPYVLIHHSDTDSCTSRAVCQARMRNIQACHMNNNHRTDIGYTFVISEDGNIYEARGWDSYGAHAQAYNARSVGICIVGNYQKRKPNDAALAAVSKLIKYGVAIGKIRSDYKLIGHRQTNLMICPGDKLFEYIQTLPHWEQNPS